MGIVSLTAIRDDIVTALSGVVFERLSNQTIPAAGGTVEAKYVARLPLDAARLNHPNVTAILASEDVKQAGRGPWAHEPAIVLALTQRVAVENEVAECDALVGLCQDIGDWLKTFEPPTVSASVSEIKLEAAFNYAELDENGVFEAVLEVTFKMLR